MKFDVEFQCKRCGLLTPAVAEVPDDFPPATKFRLCTGATIATPGWTG